jgi:hypothetical protein
MVLSTPTEERCFVNDPSRDDVHLDPSLLDPGIYPLEIRNGVQVWRERNVLVR